MEKVTGLQSNYAPITEDASRIIINYGYEVVAGTDMATWHEIVRYKKQTSQLTLSDVKQAVLADIDERTRASIISGLTWNGKPVWLSTENQMDWKAGYDRALRTEGAILPLKYKIGEAADGQPVYHTFTSLNAFGDFTDTWQQHIQQCLTDGWAEKDAIDWSVYGLTEGEPADSTVE